jgi:hypothetical protein
MTVLAFVVDNGVRLFFFSSISPSLALVHLLNFLQLAFIMAMAFVGWIRGYKTQGSSRAVVEVPLDDLYGKFVKRFLTPRGSKTRKTEISQLMFSKSGDVHEVEAHDEQDHYEEGGTESFRGGLTREHTSLLIDDTEGIWTG